MNRRLSLLVAATLAAASFNTLAQTSTANTFGAALDSAWNSRDSARVEKLFAERARATDVRVGDTATHREAIARQISAQWQAVPANARQRTVINEQRDLGNGQSVIDATLYVETANAAGVVETLAETGVTAVIANQGNEVEVISLRNTRALGETAAQASTRKFRITRGLGRPFASQG